MATSGLFEIKFKIHYQDGPTGNMETHRDREEAGKRAALLAMCGWDVSIKVEARPLDLNDPKDYNLATGMRWHQKGADLP